MFILKPNFKNDVGSKGILITPKFHGGALVIFAVNQDKTLSRINNGVAEIAKNYKFQFSSEAHTGTRNNPRNHA